MSPVTDRKKGLKFLEFKETCQSFQTEKSTDQLIIYKISIMLKNLKIQSYKSAKKAKEIIDEQ